MRDRNEDEDVAFRVGSGIIQDDGAAMPGSHRETASTARLRFARRAYANAAWLLLIVAVIAFLSITYRKYVPMDPAAYSIFWSRREWLWAHLAGGALTLLLGPFQFLARLRNAYPRLHRWTGRIYLLAMLVACVGAAGLIATTPGGVGLQIAFAATEIAWLFTALMGFIAIRRRLPSVHRRWMVRNYTITFVFVTFRAAIRVPGVMDLAPPAVMIPTLLWLGWVVPLFAYEASVGVIDWMCRSRSGQSGMGARDGHVTSIFGKST